MSVTMTDAELIDYHGGPTKLAEKLGYDIKGGGVQRVQNWITRGIPPAVKLQFPHLFLQVVPRADGLQVAKAA